jgi:hypothetical protein
VYEPRIETRGFFRHDTRRLGVDPFGAAGIFLGTVDVRVSGSVGNNVRLHLPYRPPQLVRLLEIAAEPVDFTTAERRDLAQWRQGAL